MYYETSQKVTMQWFRCHGCGWECWWRDGARNSRGCENPTCYTPNLHIHTDGDGEQPKTLKGTP